MATIQQNKILTPLIKIRNNTIFNNILVLIFFLLVFINLVNHEMWRDELQAWQIARDSLSINDLVKNLRYEGHPGLWHFGLYFLSRFTRNPIIMKFFHLIIITFSIYIFVNFSPFNKLQKTLIAFGYFLFYEYAVISRNYALGVLFVFSFCAFFTLRNKNYIFLACVLALLANTSVYGTMIAIALGLTLLFERLWIKNKREFFSQRKWDILISSLIFLVGIISAIYQMLPPPDRGRGLGWTTEFNWRKLTETLFALVQAYLPIPSFFTEDFRGNLITELMEKVNNNPEYWSIIASTLILITLLALAIIFFAEKPVILFLYLIGNLEILLFNYLKYYGSLRHHGSLFLLFLACLWLSSYYPESNFIHNWIKNKKNVITIKQLKLFLLYAIINFHFAVGLFAFYIELSHPFSAAQETANFIKKQNLNKMIIAGYPASKVSSVAGLVDKKIYYLQPQKFQGFLVWDKPTIKELNSQEILERVTKLIAQTQQSIILILNYDLEQASPDLKITRLAEFTQSMIYSERYYLYTVTFKEK